MKRFSDSEMDDVLEQDHAALVHEYRIQQRVIVALIILVIMLLCWLGGSDNWAPTP